MICVKFGPPRWGLNPENGSAGLNAKTFEIPVLSVPSRPPLSVTWTVRLSAVSPGVWTGRRWIAWKSTKNWVSVPPEVRSTGLAGV